MDDLNVVIATDCGSTTTKAILIEKKDEGYRQTFRGEAPTTVEAPFEDVTRGVLNAIQEVEELSGRQILNGERIITPADGNVGVDIYISTSSAGGGLQMVVAGVVLAMTGESAQRCALGAGAIVMDALAANDGRLPHEKIERIRQLRPDMVLLSGGTDGGTVSHVVELAEFISAADPKPRFGAGFKLPVIFAGNEDAREEVENALGGKMALTVTENIRPVLEEENLDPARHVIHDLFLEHVMAQAPGYRKLMDWTSAPIMPTPGAVGEIMQTIARQQGINVVGVDIGGATTDVFSVFDDVFNRTVSANLGMSYSVSNVLAEAGLDHIMRWVPFDIEEADLRDRIKNKMIRPTTIPQLMQELQVEQAIAREALRLAFDQHRALAVGLKGVQSKRTLADVFEQGATGESLVEMMALDMLVGSGGVLSHAPRREQSCAMLIDAFQPEGVTRLAVDSIFMMPHLGVLSTVDERAATEVFERDCLIYLGTCVAPVGEGKDGEVCLQYEIDLPSGRQTGQLQIGQLQWIPLADGEEVEVSLQPARRWNVGAGPGQALNARVRGGIVGLVLDGRGRPIQMASDQDRRRQISDWQQALNLYE
ncbi:MAG: methylaspartate mutase [Gemmatimonadetes bacterium]|nr:methylaspartate mutase [Gemmatimonadota bacterium]MYB71283.1 methylaspartate mutase [Gemmatimonadota bacterium]